MLPTPAPGGDRVPLDGRRALSKGGKDSTAFVATWELASIFRNEGVSKRGGGVPRNVSLSLRASKEKLVSSGKNRVLKNRKIVSNARENRRELEQRSSVVTGHQIG